MNRPLCGAASAALTLFAVVGSAWAQPPAEWQRVYADDTLVIDARSRTGSNIKELKAEGTITAPPHVVNAVLADVGRYPAFMPYVKKSEVVGRDAGDVIVYQRLSFPLLGLVKDRDYVIRIGERTYVDAGHQPVYRRAWHLEPSWPYPRDESAVRISIDDGFWYLRAADAAGQRTTAVYCLFTDPGGSLPAWIINQANTTAVQKVFAAVRETVRDPRYASVSPPEPSRAGAPPLPRDGGCAPDRE